MTIELGKTHEAYQQKLVHQTISLILQNASLMLEISPRKR